MRFEPSLYHHPFLTGLIVLAHLKESIDYYKRLEVAELEGDLLKAIIAGDQDKVCSKYRLLVDARSALAPVIIAPFLLLLSKSLPKTRNNPEPSLLQKNILSGLFGKGQFSTTVFLWTATFGTLLVMYLLLGWMPSLLVAMGLSESQAQYAQMLYNVGSSMGAAAGGYLLDKKLLYTTPGTAYVALAVFLTIFGFLALDYHTALIVMFGVGAMVTIAQATLYAFAPLCYPPSIRNTGVGAAVAAGRLGTIARPLLAGSLLGVDQTAVDVLMVLIPITLVSGLMAILVVKMFTGQNQMNI